MLHRGFSPAALRYRDDAYGPVSGLISGGGLIYHLPMRGHSGILINLLLSYRCGGSVGFSPTSRLTDGGKSVGT